MKGKIQFVNERPYGNKTLRSFKLAGGDKTLYRWGDTAFPGFVKPGAEVEFDVTVNGESTTVVATSLREAVVAPPSQNAPVSVAGSGGGTAWPAKDLSIQYQSSRSHAIQFLDLLLARDIIKIPAKHADKLRVIEATLDLYTSQFYTDIATKGAVARVLEAENGTPEPGVDAPVVEGDD